MSSKKEESYKNTITDKYLFLVYPNIKQKIHE